MTTTARILYIQHAGSLGGSCMSLLYLVQSLDRSRYEPVIACIHPAPEVISLYQRQGIETLYWPGISPFEHTTLGWAPLYDPRGWFKMIRQLWRFAPSARATQALVTHIDPEIVHLNSLVLAPSALGVKRSKVPLIWHVREPVHPGHIGVRRRLLSRVFLRWADEGIYISVYDQKQLSGGSKGIVIHNFVDFTQFDHTIDGMATRAELNLRSDAKVIAFLGGQSVVKGIFPLLKAMKLVKQQVPEAHLLIAGGAYHSSGRLVSRVARTLLPRVKHGTVAQRVDNLIRRCEMQGYVHLLEWRTDIPQLLAASDVLVFPSIAPHFARPVIEAGAMRKPVVASRIGGVEELVVHGETGLLVPPGDFHALAGAISGILRCPSEASQMGQKGLVHARRSFNADTNVRQTIEIYERLLKS